MTGGPHPPGWHPRVPTGAYLIFLQNAILHLEVQYCNISSPRGTTIHSHLGVSTNLAWISTRHPGLRVVSIRWRFPVSYFTFGTQCHFVSFFLIHIIFDFFMFCQVFLIIIFNFFTFRQFASFVLYCYLGSDCLSHFITFNNLFWSFRLFILIRSSCIMLSSIRWRFINFISLFHSFHLVILVTSYWFRLSSAWSSFINFINSFHPFHLVMFYNYFESGFLYLDHISSILSAHFIRFTSSHLSICLASGYLHPDHISSILSAHFIRFILSCSSIVLPQTIFNLVTFFHQFHHLISSVSSCYAHQLFCLEFSSTQSHFINFIGSFHPFHLVMLINYLASGYRTPVCTSSTPPPVLQSCRYDNISAPEFIIALVSGLVARAFH